MVVVDGPEERPFAVQMDPMNVVLVKSGNVAAATIKYVMKLGWKRKRQT